MLNSKKIKNIISLLTIIALILSGYLGYIYSETISLNDLRGSDEYGRTIAICEEGDYVARLSSYTIDGVKRANCFYYKKNNIFRNRYEIYDGISDFKLGELVYNCSFGNKKNVILVSGIDLPEEAKMYSIELYEEDMKILGDIKDNYVLKLFVMDGDSNASCGVRLIDEEYNEVE